MKVVRFNESQEYHAPQQEYRRTRILIDEEKIGRKDIVVGYGIYGPGVKAPFHVHEGSETMFIVHGKGRFGTKEKTVEVDQGNTLYFNPGEEHYLESIGSQTLEFVYIYSKPGDERPLKEKWIPIKK